MDPQQTPSAIGEPRLPLGSGSDLVETVLPLGVDAPGLARSAVARHLAARVAPSVLEDALLLVSELVTNSVRHSGAPEGDDLVLRVHLWRDACRLEVEDRGRHGTIAPYAPGRFRDRGWGLYLVELLSERWGVVRTADGATRVWLQLSSFRAAQ